MFFAGQSRKQESRDPHCIHQKVLLDAQKSGVISLNSRGLSYVPPVVWTLNRPLPPKENAVSFESAGDDTRWWEMEPIQRLNLSANTIKELPGPGLAQLDTLVSLDVRDNELTTLPEEIALLTQLKQLFLSSNKLTCLPGALSQLHGLVLLDAAHNLLTELPSGLEALVDLEKLDVSDNRLAQLPLLLPPKLISLKVNQNRLVRLPEGLLQSCQSLRELDASENVLENVGISGGGNQSSLTTICLCKNRLTAIPALSPFHKLKEVALGDNKIDEFSLVNLAGLGELAILDLSRNRIPAIPLGIPESLPALSRLDLSNNDLKSIPTELGFMESLNVLSLCGNPFRSVPQNVLSSGTQALKALLRDRHQADTAPPPPAFSRSPTGSPDVPATADDPSTLNYADLPAVNTSSILDWSCSRNLGAKRIGHVAANLREELPPLDDPVVWRAVALRGCGSNAVVKTLNLLWRQLDTFPMGIMAFRESLTSLNLSHNRLTHLPDEIGRLSRLEELNVSNNCLNSLPQTLTALAALQTLVLDFNAGLGPQLPAETLFRAPLTQSLVNLSARSCRLTQLPPASMLSPESMPALRSLDVSENDISTLEPRLGLCTQIQNLQVMGNTFRVPRPAVVAKGTAALMEYLRSRIAE
uniref:Leucine-rich repeat-containing protein 40 n=1 Tax=Mesocestoides corti TaxID=53468 RepID=A0A5K3FDB3_MESCO